MKTPRPFAIALAACALGIAAAAAGARLLVKAPTTGCQPDAPVNGIAGQVPATSVVVRPWFGKHHVYGVFVIPDEYMDMKYSETISVQDFALTLIRTEAPQNQHVDGVVPPRGHYVHRAYLPTRVALWFLFTGRFGDLGQACNWTLRFTERHHSTVPAN